MATSARAVNIIKYLYEEREREREGGRESVCVFVRRSMCYLIQIYYIYCSYITCNLLSSYRFIIHL